MNLNLNWSLNDLKNIKKNNFKVFSCFHCGGGSSMGYKLAGYEVLGGVEIDPKIMEIYKTNHNPKYSYLMSVKEFNKIPNENLPRELFNLDILDGSPPCSSFSMAGSREEKWNKKTFFKEGQAKQVLDDLFFDFIETADKLKPKIIIAENVKGLILGNAKGYVKEIINKLNDIGYKTQLFLLNAAFMDVPQMRERVFFIAQKKEHFKKLELNFNKNIIPFKKIDDGNVEITKKTKLSETFFPLWQKCKVGKDLGSVDEKGNFFNYKKIDPKFPIKTITSKKNLLHHKYPRYLTFKEYVLGQTFPYDYNFLKEDPIYILGMSVPPFMIANLSNEIKNQLLLK